MTEDGSYEDWLVYHGHTCNGVDPAPVETCPGCRLEQEPVTIISILFTTEDVYSMADASGVDREVALERALDWGKHIEQTMMGYCSEQLVDVIERGAP